MLLSTATLPVRITSMIPYGSSNSNSDSISFDSPVVSIVIWSEPTSTVLTLKIFDNCRISPLFSLSAETFKGKLSVLNPNYKKIDSEKLEKLVKENAVALDIRLDNQWKKTGVIKGSFQETAFDINGKFNVYLMDRVRALAGAESQNIEIVFIYCI